MKLIFGLGNPGREYENTRHNVGFSLLDKIAESNQFCFCNSKFGASYLEYIIDGEKVMLIKPYKFINLSGEVVKKFVDYYKVDLTDIEDDLAINDFNLYNLGDINTEDSIFLFSRYLSKSKYQS